MTGIAVEVPVLTIPGPNAGEASSAHAARVIREAILSGALAPGSVIPQGTLAEQMGISRIPVRDALRQLESEGLVQIPTNRAARVAVVGIEELRELYDLREMIEPYAISKSVPLLNRSTLDRIATLAEMFDARIDSEEEVLRIDKEFHALSMSAVPSMRVKRLVQELMNATQQYRRAHWAANNEHEYVTISHDHHELVHALVSRDAESAAAIAKRHLRRTRELLEERLSK
ncbi:GntR family transcriptional regulator [Leucobacter rhizosphaerae]|uniref:GntR family transcriptional regulator n=1 Tax=Leucobacter rhizosphaerae TaxID=2932245 RepID=A0ABY4FYW0_9MICO|nr:MULTISPECIES: GntR family transcriptional regulator [Leucobacter]UOQ61490.1 GntR family transcriptional regulator [Leucobacter rhizosphaerae]UOR02406.1 GntR family transcriptional regulator [Leucobacter allii]